MVKVKQINNKNSIEKQPKKTVKTEEYKLYQKYIKSPEFRALRDIVLERDNYRCRCCGRTLEEIADTKLTLQAHHSTYEHLGECNEKEIEDIITLCSACHKGVHSATSNLKRFSDKHHITTIQH